MPAEVARLVASVGERNPANAHLVFGEVQARDLIADHFGPREVAAFEACAVPAMQADYLRYCALEALGGTWIDADSYCLRPLGDLIKPDDQGLAPTPPEMTFPAANDFLFVQHGHPLPGVLREIATANIEDRFDARLGFVTGPWLLAGLGLIYMSGSFAACRRKISGSHELRLLDTIEQTVVDYERISEIFNRLRTIPRSDLVRWVRPEHKLMYKRRDTHWRNWQKTGRSIYR